MSAGIELGFRVLVPRWVGPEMSRALGMFPVSREPWRVSELNSRHLHEKISNWESEKSVVKSVEILSNALMVSEFENSKVRDVARYVISHGLALSPHVNSLAEFFCRDRNGGVEFDAEAAFSSPEDPARGISKQRFLIQNNPRNSHAWANLSYYYALLGHREKSVDAALVAYQIGSDSPYISIKSSRALLHYGDVSRALYMLEKSSSFKRSPLLVSAAVSVRSMHGLRLKHLDLLKRSSEKDVLSGHGVNHAAMAMATFEAGSGKRRAANALIDRSMTVPDENCLAQAVWLSEKRGTEETDRFHAPFDFEASARKYYISGKFKKAFESCVMWQKFQPFSRHPATFGSYIASVVLQDYSAAESVAKVGYFLSSDDHLVANNYAVSLALNGKVDEAMSIFSKIKADALTKDDYATYCSSLGLIYFCMGSIEKGREWYQISNRALAAAGDIRAQAISLAFWAEQEEKFDEGRARRLKDRCRELVKKASFKDLDNRLRS